MVGYYVWRTLQGGAAIQISSIRGVANARARCATTCAICRSHSARPPSPLLVVALARPQDVEQNTSTNTEGIDIMLAIDVSGSMLARDFSPDRITAAKEVAGSFIADRYGDRIGLVAFAGEAFTQSPLTDRPEHARNPPGPDPQRADRGRHGHRQRTRYGHQPPARKRCQVEGHHPADRRREQPRRDRPADRRRNRQGAGHPPSTDRCGHGWAWPLSGHRHVRQHDLRQPEGRDRRKDPRPSPK